jgi:hypothetical protein
LNENQLQPEYSNEAKKQLRTFYDLPDISPVVPLEDSEKSWNAMSSIKWDKATEEDKALVLNNTESIKIRKV